MSTVGSVSSGGGSPAPSAPGGGSRDAGGTKGTSDAGGTKGTSDAGGTKGTSDSGGTKGTSDSGAPKTDTTDKSSLTPDGQAEANNPENYLNPDGSYDVAKAMTDFNTQKINEAAANFIANMGKSEDIHCAFMDSGQSPFGGGGGMSGGTGEAGGAAGNQASGLNPQNYLKEDGSYDVAKAMKDFNTQKINEAASNFISNMGKSEDIHCAFMDSGQSPFGGAFSDGGGGGGGNTMGNGNMFEGFGEVNLNPQNYLTENGDYDVAQAMKDFNTQQINNFGANFIQNMGKTEDISCIFGKNGMSPFG